MEDARSIKFIIKILETLNPSVINSKKQNKTKQKAQAQTHEVWSVEWLFPNIEIGLGL